MPSFRNFCFFGLAFVYWVLFIPAPAQEASTGAIRGTVADGAGGRIGAATSGRPISATVTGDANQDGNTTNDRLPGTSRNSLVEPDYAATDMRLTRRLQIGDRMKLELAIESFNLLNRDNQRVQITQDRFITNSAQFVQTSKRIGINYFRAQYRTPTSFRRATDAYAPRQVQFALKLIF
jgi:hypothetical protein